MVSNVSAANNASVVSNTWGGGGKGNEGGTSGWKTNEDFAAGWVAFSQLDPLWWGYILNRVTDMRSHIFGIFFGLEKSGK